jgi:hypothetical protein
VLEERQRVVGSREPRGQPERSELREHSGQPERAPRALPWIHHGWAPHVHVDHDDRVGAGRWREESALLKELLALWARSWLAPRR